MKPVVAIVAQAFLFTFFIGLLPAYSQEATSDIDEKTYEVKGRTASGKEVKRNFLDLFNAKYLFHALQAYNIHDEEGVKAALQQFTAKTGIPLITVGYVDANDPYSKVFRKHALKRFEEATGQSLIHVSGQVVFAPNARDHYEMKLEMTPSDFLHNEGTVTRQGLNARTEVARKKYWNNKVYERPKDARPDLAAGYGELLGDLEDFMVENGHVLASTDETITGIFDPENILELTLASNYSLGPKEISLSYRIKNWKNALLGRGVSDLEMSSYQMLLFVEKKGEIVYSYAQPVNEKGTVKWHGLVFQEDEPVSSKNFHEYKLHLGVLPKDTSEEIYKHWTVQIGSRPGSTVIRSGLESRTFIDLKPNIEFEVGNAWEDWMQVSDEVKKITTYTDYEKIEQIIRNEPHGIGEIFEAVENPLQFLYDNSVETTFLGTKVRVHWTMADKLKAVESRLTDQSIKSGRYRPGDIGGIGIRPMYGKSQNYVSNHSYGLVVDIKANHNHYIGSGQAELIYFIQHVTGRNLFDKNARTAQKIVDANAKFKMETEGLSYDKLLTIYAEVDDYHNKPENKYRLEELNTTNPLSEIEPIAADVSIGIIDKGRISEFYVKLEKLNVLLNQREQRYYLEYLVFDEVARAELEDFRQRISGLTTALMPLESDFTEENILNVISSLSLPDITSVSNFVASYSSYRSSLEQKIIIGRDDELIIFKKFAQQLKNSASTKEFIKHVFQNGFCEVPLDLIQAFADEPDMQWGGTWNGDNVDYMHFEVRAQAIEKYLSQEKPKQ